MMRFYLTRGLVIVFFLLQCGNLSITQDDSFFGDLIFKRFQAFFEILKIISQPDSTHTTTGDKDPFLS
jgi:hypothetical protein